MGTEVTPDLPEMERKFGMENGFDGAQVAENGVVAGEAATAGGATENGSVAHGEGEIKPVMLENEYEGGSKETALKTAPEGAGGDSGLGGANSSARITEAEARAMLLEDNARAKEDLKKANSRGKRMLIAVLVLAVALIAAGVGVSIILGGIER